MSLPILCVFYIRTFRYRLLWTTQDIFKIESRRSIHHRRVSLRKLSQSNMYSNHKFLNYVTTTFNHDFVFCVRHCTQSWFSMLCLNVLLNAQLQARSCCMNNLLRFAQLQARSSCINNVLQFAQL